MKIGIDLGHNCAHDGGAIGFKKENDLIKEVGLKVISKLRTNGHTIIDCSPKGSVTSLSDSLYQRTSAANRHNCDIFVSIHFNAFHDPSAHGTEVLYVSPAGKKLATPVLTELVNLGFRNRGLKYRDNLHVLNATQMPAILVEGCFVTSRRDMGLYNAEKMANAIVKGLIGHIPPNSPSVCKCL